MPLFSIVIPTRNRADLLVHAITSALNQDFDDYEIIVSDNSSSDGTNDVVTALDHNTTRRYKTDRPLSMVDHWNYALDKATGEWVLFLSDDDALVPDCLSYLARVIANHEGTQAFQYNLATYVYDDGVEGKGNHISGRWPQAPFTSVDSHAHLEFVFTNMQKQMPKFLNSVVSKRLVYKIRETYGKVFHNWAPDWASGILLLANTMNYTIVNKPLGLWGKSLYSYGSGSRSNPAKLREFFNEFAEFNGQFIHSPYPELMTVSNCLLDTLYRTRSLLGHNYKNLEVDQWKFHQALNTDIRIYLDKGHQEYEEYYDTITMRLNSLTRPARSIGTFSLPRRAYNRAKRVLRNRTLTPKRSRIISANGLDYHFQNIYEAAQVLGGICEKLESA